MGSFVVEDEIAAGIDAVWAKFEAFDGIADWVPTIDKCELEGEGIGAIRKMSMGGMTIHERLEAFDAAARSLSYSITEGPIPVENYLATIKLTAAGEDRTHISWGATFDAPTMSEEQQAGVAAGMEGAYKGMIGALQQALAG